METTKKNKPQFAVKPTLYAACVELAKGNTAAGGLLHQIAVRSKGGTLKDENGVIGWLAMTRNQWRCVTGFTRHQYDDAISFLKRAGLVEYRRRKLKYKDRAALSWCRLPDSTKSAIAEIMERPALSAFAEMPVPPDSVIADNDALPISDDAESLMENEIEEKENGSENVVIAETTKIESPSFNQEKESKKNKSKKKPTGNISKKDWFYATMKEVYKDCTNYSPEPYQEAAAKFLQDALDYLETNPGGVLEACPSGHQTSIYALGQVIVHWKQFASFAEAYFKGFNIPTTPQLWSLKHQLKAIPDFVKLKLYTNETKLLFIEAGIPYSEPDLYYPEDVKKFYEYLELPAEKKKEFLVGVMKSSYDYKHYQKKLEKMAKLNANKEGAL